MEWPKPTPRLRSTVESVRSRCQREMGSLADRCSKSALATPRLPSEFSKSMGFTCRGKIYQELGMDSAIHFVQVGWHEGPGKEMEGM